MQFESLDEFDVETGPERLLGVTPAGHPSTAGTPISLSRGESQQARLRRHSLGAALRRLSSRVRDRLVKKAVSGPGATERDPESDGIIIATLLVIATVAYGSFLTALSTR
jgi:hypothetical protein